MSSHLNRRSKDSYSGKSSNRRSSRISRDSQDRPRNRRSDDSSFGDNSRNIEFREKSPERGRFYKDSRKNSNRSFNSRSSYRDLDERGYANSRRQIISRRNTNNPSAYNERNKDSDSDYSYKNEFVNDSKEKNTDLLWGRHSTQAALESGRPLHRIWCTQEIRSSSKFFQLLRDSKSSGVLVEEVTWARLGQITNGAVHQGIVIQVAAAETLDLPTLINSCKSLGESPLLLALDGLTDPQNLGAIVRSAEALGAHGLVLPQRRSAGLTGTVAKVAAGALEHLPVARVVNLNRSLEQLKKAGYQVIGLAEEGNVTFSELSLEGPLVVVLGSEGKGISVVTKRHCDHLVRIPLRGVTTSLNASVAAAIVLYEVARTGWMKGLTGQSPSPRMVKAKYSSQGITSTGNIE